MILWTGFNSFAEGLKLNWQLEQKLAAPPSLIEELENAWFGWEVKFKVPPQAVGVFIKSNPRNFSHEWARTSGFTIELSPALIDKYSKDRDPVFLRTVLEHELGHVFLNAYLPQVNQNVLIQETFAYYISGDFRRVFLGLAQLNTDNYFASKAVKFFRDHKSQLHQNKNLYGPLARLMTEQVDKGGDGGVALENLYLDAFKLAAQNRLNTETLQNDLFDLLTGRETIPTKNKALDFGLEISKNENRTNNEEGFLMLDGVSHLPLFEVGDLSQRLMPGSLLKPLFLAAVPRMKKTRDSRKHDSWDCEVGATHRVAPILRQWTWEEALAKSCNGFFIDGVLLKEGEWKKYNSYLRDISESFRTKITLTPAQAVGLMPGVELTPREILHIYIRLLRENSDIIAALDKTARIGTLSKNKESEWFVKNNILLKSGTVRDLNGAPQIGWLLGIHRNPVTKIPDWFSIYYKKGTTPAEMLQKFRHLVEPVATLATEPIKVQILGLVPETVIRIHCFHPEFNFRASDLKIDKTYHCDGGPFILEFPDSKGHVMTRSYFGDLVRSRPSHLITDRRDQFERPLSASEKQMKARRGSTLRLSTSMLSYSAHVLISEMSNGRVETIKALALAIQQNARTHPTHDDFVCDTTHCQVFAADWTLTSRDDRRILLGVLSEIEGRHLVHWKPNLSNETLKWFPFSRGGSDPWTLIKSDVTLRVALGVQKFDSIEIRTGPRIAFLFENQMIRQYECEIFRNQIQILSCPNSIHKTAGGWEFSGNGEGHSQGLDLIKADALAAQGATYGEILEHFYPGCKIDKNSLVL